MFSLRNKKNYHYFLLSGALVFVLSYYSNIVSSPEHKKLMVVYCVWLLPVTICQLSITLPSSTIYLVHVIRTNLTHYLYGRKISVKVSYRSSSTINTYYFLLSEKSISTHEHLNIGITTFLKQSLPTCKIPY